MKTRCWFQRVTLLWSMLGGPVGCSSWRVETVPPAKLVERDHPDRVRLKRLDGRREVLYQPELRGDSLWGRREDHSSPQAGRAVALAGVTQVETSHFRADKTIVAVVGIGGAAAALTYGILVASVADDWGY